MAKLVTPGQWEDVLGEHLSSFALFYTSPCFKHCCLFWGRWTLLWPSKALMFCHRSCYLTGRVLPDVIQHRIVLQLCPLSLPHSAWTAEQHGDITVCLNTCTKHLKLLSLNVLFSVYDLQKAKASEVSKLHRFKEGLGVPNLLRCF